MCLTAKGTQAAAGSDFGAFAGAGIVCVTFKGLSTSQGHAVPLIYTTCVCCACRSDLASSDGQISHEGCY